MPYLASSALEEISELISLVVSSGLLFFPVMQSPHCLEADIMHLGSLGKDMEQ